MAIDPQEAARIRAADRSWRERNRASVGSNPMLVCARCGWKIANNDAKAQGITACGRCGARECRVHALDYVGGNNHAVQVLPPRQGGNPGNQG